MIKLSLIFFYFFVECTEYTYGTNCTSKCGHCKDGVTCNFVDGSCPDGCQLGWNGDYCQTGMYILFET